MCADLRNNIISDAVLQRRYDIALELQRDLPAEGAYQLYAARLGGTIKIRQLIDNFTPHSVLYGTGPLVMDVMLYFVGLTHLLEGLENYTATCA